MIFAGYLEKHLSRFIDNFIYEEEDILETTASTNHNVSHSNNDSSIKMRRIQTKEGKNAVIEAIQYLKSIPTSSFPLFQSNMWLATAALDHVKDIGPLGSVEHAVSVFSCFE